MQECFSTCNATLYIICKKMLPVFVMIHDHVWLEYLCTNVWPQSCFRVRSCVSTMIHDYDYVVELVLASPRSGGLKELFSPV